MSQYRFSIIGQDGTQKMFASIRARLAGVRSAVNSTQLKFAALAGVTGIGAIVNANRKTIDALAKTSDQLGIQTEKLALLQHAADLSGSSSDALEKGLKKLTKSISDGADGLSTYVRAFDKLKLDPAELKAMTPDEQFRKVGAALAGVETQTDRVAIAYDLFGGRNTALLNTLTLVGDEYENLEKEVDAYGLAISRVDAAKVEDANDQLHRVGQVVKGLGQKITVKLAPVISVIAEKFIGAATEGDRMGKVVDRAMRFAVKGVGIFADGIHGVKVIFKAVQIGADLFAAGVLTVFRSIVTGAVEAGNTIVNFVLAPIRSALELAAKFSDTAADALASLNDFSAIETPGFVNELDGQLESLYGSISEGRAQLHELLMADLPSAVIEQKWAEIQAEAERRAIETRDRIAARLEGEGGAEGGDVEVETEAERKRREAKEQREREQIAARLARLDEQYLNEEDKLRLKFEREQAIVDEAHENRLISDEEHERRSLEIKQRSEDAQLKLAEAGATARRNIIAGTLGKLAGALGGHSRKMFKVQKAASLAQAAVALPAAVVDAIKNAGGLPFGAFAGAMTLAAGAAQIASIKSQTFQGGGGMPPAVSAGGGSSSSASPPALGASIGSQFNAPSQQETQPTTVVNFTIAGDVVGDTAETILGKMRSLIEEQDAVLFSSNSRQAAELVPTG